MTREPGNVSRRVAEAAESGQESLCGLCASARAFFKVLWCGDTVETWKGVPIMAYFSDAHTDACPRSSFSCVS